MSEREEPPLLTLILFPFRLLAALADLIVNLWLLLIFGGIAALIGAFLWLVLTGVPE